MGIESEVFSKFIPTQLRETEIRKIDVDEAFERIVYCQLFRVIKEINR